MVILENIDIDIDIDIDMVILENIDIDKAILQNIDIDKISNRFKFGISNRATCYMLTNEIRRWALLCSSTLLCNISLLSGQLILALLKRSLLVQSFVYVRLYSQ